MLLLTAGLLTVGLSLALIAIVGLDRGATTAREALSTNAHPGGGDNVVPLVWPEDHDPPPRFPGASAARPVRMIEAEAAPACRELRLAA